MRKLFYKCPWCKKSKLDFDEWLLELAEIKGQIRYFENAKMMRCDTKVYDLAIKQLEKQLSELMDVKKKLNNNHPYRCM